MFGHARMISVEVLVCSCFPLPVNVTLKITINVTFKNNSKYIKLSFSIVYFEHVERYVN